MKLLIVTQRVDRTDSILGFFHGWICAFAARLTGLQVIGQQTGTHDLPGNVRVHTLGKESGVSRFKQIVRFWKIIIVQRREYDAVFVHMTPVWVLLGWPVWVLLRKPIYLWYEARGGGWVLPIALLFSRKVFGATDYGLPRRSRRRVIVGHGIDTERFRPGTAERTEGLLVAVGRVTPVKHYDLLIQTLAALPQHCSLQIAGGTFTDRDEREMQRLLSLQRELGISARVTMGWKSPDEVRDLLQRADCMMHACSGGLDKCVLEAMASGCPVISTSEAARRVLPMTCCARPEEFADRVRWVLGLSAQERSELAMDLRQRVVNGHSLSHLVDRLVSEMRC
jgi:glycosyltransferase involved in cell wall biosynthesis